MTGLLSATLIVHTTLFAAASLRADASRDLEKLVRPFFSQHCNSCHGKKKQKGDLRVDTLAVDLRSPKIMGHWEEIMSRIISGDMPPEDEPQPKVGEISRVGDWIATQLREAEIVRQSSGERVTFHKLSRNEYANTIRDLLASAWPR